MVNCFAVPGLLLDMQSIVVTSVALGKAHGVLLTNKGHIYTFGLNNKGQCGREYVAGAAAGPRDGKFGGDGYRTS